VDQSTGVTPPPGDVTIRPLRFRMKKARKLSSFPSRILVVTCLVFAFAGRSGAYDVPDFQHGLFDPDGLFLEGNLRDSLLEALAAVASNYPGNPRVDEDLCEKALAIALRIDPLHFHSRAAHEAHARGREPKPTSFFSEPAGVVELLWKNGLEFSAPDSEPERRRLGPHLMEISLLLHPELPRERRVSRARPSWLTLPRIAQWDVRTVDRERKDPRAGRMRGHGTRRRSRVVSRFLSWLPCSRETMPPQQGWRGS